MTTDSPFPAGFFAPRPIEVRFFTPGKGWGCKTFATEAAYARWAAKLDDDIEVRLASDPG